jgi:hypothetical protein
MKLRKRLMGGSSRRRLAQISEFFKKVSGWLAGWLARWLGLARVVVELGCWHLARCCQAAHCSRAPPHGALPGQGRLPPVWRPGSRVMRGGCSLLRAGAHQARSTSRGGTAAHRAGWARPSQVDSLRTAIATNPSNPQPATPLCRSTWRPRRPS